MFRRARPLRRFAPGRPPRNPIAPALMALLMNANRLADSGRYAEAAPMFGQLAQEAEKHQKLGQAVRLHVRAAECYGQTGNKTALMNHARRALSLAQNSGDSQRAATLLQRLTQALNEHGLRAEAETLQREFGGMMGLAPAGAPPPASRRLPATCPQCAAPVRNDEVDWIDEDSAECAYCGGVIQTLLA